jgi:hypothetical protein
MGKRKAPQHIRDMRKEGLQAKPKVRAVQMRKVAASVVTILLAFFGLWTGIAYFWPEISVNATEPLNDDPFSAPFIIENSGNFAITSVNAKCVPISVRNANGANLNEGEVRNYMKPIPILAAKEKGSIQCAISPVILFTPSANFADVVLVVSYHPAFTPWINKQMSFRFHTVQQSDSHLRWEPKGLTDPN